MSLILIPCGIITHVEASVGQNLACRHDARQNLISITFRYNYITFCQYGPSTVLSSSISSSDNGHNGGGASRHRSVLSRFGAGPGSGGANAELDPSIQAARERVMGAEQAEAEADRALAAARLRVREARDEVKRLEAVELAVADDPLARQSVIEEAAEEAVKASGRSTAGRAGQRGGNKRSKRRR